MTQDMKLVIKNGRRRRLFLGRQRQGLPHVHHRQADGLAPLRAQPLIKLIQAGFRPVGATKPDRPPLLQIADHNPILMALANRDFIDPDHPWPCLRRAPQLFLHVLLIQSFDRMPVQPQLPGHRLQTHLPAAPSHKKGEAFRICGFR